MRKVLIFIVTMISFIIVLSLNAGLQAAEAETYFLMYQGNDYDSKIGDSIDYFFQKVIKGQDNLILFTPVRSYNFSQKTRQSNPLKMLIDRTKKVVKKDIAISSSGFRSIEDSMIQVVKGLSEFLGTNRGSGMTAQSGSGNEIKSLLTQYKQVIESYRSQRKIKEEMFLAIAAKLKPIPGRKFFYIVYEKTFRIIPDRDTMDVLRANSNYAFLASEAFVEENTTELINTAKVTAALKDAGVTVQFIYLKKNPRRRQGMEYLELSGDMYNVLSKIAEGTGGLVLTTTKPAAAMKKVSEG